MKSTNRTLLIALCVLGGILGGMGFSSAVVTLAQFMASEPLPTGIWLLVGLLVIICITYALGYISGANKSIDKVLVEIEELESLVQELEKQLAKTDGIDFMVGDMIWALKGVRPSPSLRQQYIDTGNFTSILHRVK